MKCNPHGASFPQVRRIGRTLLLSTAALGLLVFAGCGKSDRAAGASGTQLSHATDERVEVFRVSPDEAADTDEPAPPSLEPLALRSTPNASPEIQRLAYTAPAESDWFEDHEAWKGEVAELADELLQDLPEKEAERVKLARRLHSDGAFLDWLLAELRQQRLSRLEPAVRERLDGLHERWQALENRLTSVSAAAGDVTPAAERRSAK